MASLEDLLGSLESPQGSGEWGDHVEPVVPDMSGFRCDEVEIELLRVGLIDSYQFSRDCTMRAFCSLHPRMTILPFGSTRDCIDQTTGELDLIIYYLHATNAVTSAATQNITELRQFFPAATLIVLSDAEDAQQPKTIRHTLMSGAHGFIATRTTSIPIVLAAIRFVNAGGTFAPIDLLLANGPECSAATEQSRPATRLTQRQIAVLSHMQQGKANKIIAYELGMSESTVKVHVRNIMRKMGATNRTQASYQAQKIWGSCDFMRTSVA